MSFSIHRSVGATVILKELSENLYYKEIIYMDALPLPHLTINIDGIMYQEITSTDTSTKEAQKTRHIFVVYAHIWYNVIKIQQYCIDIQHKWILEISTPLLLFHNQMTSLRYDLTTEMLETVLSCTHALRVQK